MAKKETKKEDTLCSTIKGMVDESISLTTTWESNNIKWYKMRMRVKKDKTFPFVGCANIRMPTIETKLRKVKAALVNTIFGIRPVVQVIPTPSSNWNSALKVEKFLDHLIMDIIKLKNKAVIGIDQSLEKGFYLLKPYFKLDVITRIEKLDIKDLSVEEAMFIFDPRVPEDAIKQAIAKKYDVDMHPFVAKNNMLSIDNIVKSVMGGKKNISVELQDVIYNFPDVALAEPERVYVPTDAGFDPQECSYIIHEFLLPLNIIRCNSKYKGWNTGEITEIEEIARNGVSYSSGTGRDKDIDLEKEMREGISLLDKSGKVKIWEFYGWYDLNGDGVAEKCVITLAPDFDIVLRKIALPFHSGKFPFVKLFYELTDDRWFSHRGIPEMIEDIVKEIDMQHCQKLDQQTIRNSPMFVYRAGMVNTNTVQFIFGQGLPAQGLQPLTDLIQPLNNNNPNVEFSYEREQMILETKVEELIGQVDFSLQSMINKRQPRTLGEVQMQYQNMQQVFSLDADLCRGAFEELFNWIWDLWCQYGDDQYEFAYFGRNGWERIRLTKEEIQGKFKITVRGNDQNTNPQVRIQKAQLILAGMNSPPALQSGVITPLNLANAYKRMYQELDIPNWEELVTMPKPKPPETAPLFKPKFKDLEDGEKAQVLAQLGIQPDMQGRALKSAAKIQEKEADNAKTQSETSSAEIDNALKIMETLKTGGVDMSPESEVSGG